MRTTTAALAAAVIALGVSGCDAIGERLLEEGAEQLSDGEVDIDDEGVSFESDEGSFEANAEGEFNMETDEGTFSSGAELPDDFPSSVPLPEGGVLLNASRMETEDGLGWLVNHQYDSGTPGDALQAHVDVLAAAGFAPPEDDEGTFNMGSGDGSGMGVQVMENGTYTVVVSAFGEPDEFVIGLQVFEQPPE